MREKYSFIATIEYTAIPPSEYQNHVKHSTSLEFYMILIPLGWNDRILNGSLWKSLIISRIKYSSEMSNNLIFLRWYVLFNNDNKLTFIFFFFKLFTVGVSIISEQSS